MNDNFIAGFEKRAKKDVVHRFTDVNLDIGPKEGPHDYEKYQDDFFDGKREAPVH